MKPTADKKNDILKGVSTLDIILKNSKIVLPGFLMILALSSIIFARPGHSILDLVDPSFNPQIQTNAFGLKWVNQIEVLPDGKFLALGGFNNYNGVPVGKLIRLNPNGSLDTTFNNNTVTEAQASAGSTIIIQPDGKIVIRSVGLVAEGREPTHLMRLNADGTFDPTLNYTQATLIHRIEMDSLGRFMLFGGFETPQGSRRIIRLNNDGSLDDSFDFILPGKSTFQNMAMQLDKVIVNTSGSGSSRIYRLNEDGSEDTSFTATIETSLYLTAVQPDNKILYRKKVSNSLFTLLRLNENGGNDDTFQTIDVTNIMSPSELQVADDGKIVFTTSSSPATIRQFLANGEADPAFTPYTTLGYASYTIQADGKIVMGDGDFFSSGANRFVRLLTDGTPDPTFNVGGRGFQFILPGNIQAIGTESNGKVLLGGKFDLINDIPRTRMARLNADSTLDDSFQINISGTEGTFSIIWDIYQMTGQSDGKIIVSGFFDYILNGVTKSNVVRLNSDGSIDTTFDLTFPIPDYSQILIGGKNRFRILSDGKLVVGTSKANNDESGPVRLTTGGSRDKTFHASINSGARSMYIDDVEILPDGKILIGGSHATNSNNFNSFVARLNADGGTDLTFGYSEEPGRLRTMLSVQENGKILVGRSLYPNGGSAKIHRLNADGTPDNSFNTVVLPDSDARINALETLPTGKIFAGGKFTVSVKDQSGNNLLQLSEDGDLEPTLYNLNAEVFDLAVDNQGRILVGGGFTIIGANNNNGESRSYIARLVDSRARFDFDGDGKTDIGIFRPNVGQWWHLRSSDGIASAVQFGNSTDKPVPADYTGDGKTDVAFWRESTGEWFILRSEDNSYYSYPFGTAGDIPAPGDFDGDGIDDTAVYRPSNGTWYILNSSGGTTILTFGISEDKPTVADYDGDGKDDIAIYRPSVSEWWQLRSSEGVFVVKFGSVGAQTVSADYTGDGKADIAFWQPSNGYWYVLRSEDNSFYSYPFGMAGDIPAPGDYDGDGTNDTAVFRPTENTWYLLQSTNGFGAVTFGTTNDVPLPSVYNVE